MEIGAIWNNLVSRHLRSTSYSLAKPKPPWHCMQASAACQVASDASSLPILASSPHGRPAAKRAAARRRIRSAASVSAWARAIGNCTDWFCPIGRSKTLRSFTYATDVLVNQRASPIASADTRMRSAFIPSRMYLKPLPSSPIRLSAGIRRFSKKTSVA